MCEGRERAIKIARSMLFENRELTRKEQYMENRLKNS